MIGRRVQIISCLICLFILFITTKGIFASEINMSDVQRLALLSVDEIIRGTPITKISDSDYLIKIQNSDKPALVIFYANRGKRSRNLATLIRYLALDLYGKINFFAYKVSEEIPVNQEVSLRLKQDFNLERTPGTIFFNPRSDDEKEVYQIYKPIFIDYRTPSLFLWRRYYDVVAHHINRFFPMQAGSKYH